MEGTGGGGKRGGRRNAFITTGNRFYSNFTAIYRNKQARSIAHWPEQSVPGLQSVIKTQ